MADSPSYTDPLSLTVPTYGDTTSAAWGDAVNATLNFLAGPPSVRVARTGDAAIVSSTGLVTWTQITWQGTTSPQWDANYYGGPMWSLGNVVTIPTAVSGTNAGLYRVSFYTSWGNQSGAATTQRGVRVVKGSTYNTNVICDRRASGRYAYAEMSGSGYVQLDEGDTVAMFCAHDMTTPGTNATIDNTSWMTVSWVGMVP